MAGRRGITEPQSSELWGERSNCPESDASKEADLSRPAAERRLGHRALLHNGSVPSLYWMLTPAAERPSSSASARAISIRSRSASACRPPAKSSCKNGETLFSMTDGNGKAIKGNSVLGHSLEAAPEAGHEDLSERRDRPEL